MSLRLIMPGLAALGSLPIHPTLIDPTTGMPLQALGVGKRGPIWPAIGGAEKDDEDDEDEGEGSGGEAEDKRDPKARIKALEEEKERHYKRAEAANKELAELREFKKKKDEEGLSEIEKVKGEASGASEKLSAAEARIRKLTIEKAFLANNTIKWHNADQALALADLSEVEVDEDGKVDVKALKAALTNLARQNKHLVKSQTDEGGSDGAADDDSDDQGGADDKGKGTDQGSASSFAGKRKGEKEKPKTREELGKRFPALNRTN